jgi:hypothetical protein
VVALAENVEVGLQDVGLVVELFADPPNRRGQGAGVEPRRQPEGKHVLGPVLLVLLERGVLQRGPGDSGQLDRDDLVGVESAVLQGVGVVARPVEVSLGERVLVDENRAALRHAVAVHLQRGGVHGHQHVDLLAGGAHLAGPKLDLKRAHAEGGAGRGADLGRVVGEGRQVVAGMSGGAGKLRPRQLHAVPRVSREQHRGVADGLRLGRLVVAENRKVEVHNV